MPPLHVHQCSQVCSDTNEAAQGSVGVAGTDKAINASAEGSSASPLSMCDLRHKLVAQQTSARSSAETCQQRTECCLRQLDAGLRQANTAVAQLGHDVYEAATLQSAPASLQLLTQAAALQAASDAHSAAQTQHQELQDGGGAKPLPASRPCATEVMCQTAVVLSGSAPSACEASEQVLRQQLESSTAQMRTRLQSNACGTGAAWVQKFAPACAADVCGNSDVAASITDWMRSFGGPAADGGSTAGASDRCVPPAVLR